MRILPAMLLLAACGVDPRGPEAPTVSTPESTPANESQPAARWVPEICGVQTWEGVAPADLAMAVVTSERGAAIFGVSKSGGPVVAYGIDEQGKMAATSGAVIANNATFTRVAASYYDGRYVVAATSGTVTMLSLVSPDLGQLDALGKVTGSMAASNPIVTAHGVHFAATAGTAGVTLSAFDAAWQAAAAAHLAPGAIGVDAIEHGDNALFAWSTNTGCVVEQLPTLKTATGLQACRAPRLADGLNSRAELAYETEEGVVVGDLYMTGNNAIASNHLVGTHGTSPRIAWDGERYWMTYLNTRGAVVVGYLSDDFNTLVSLGLEDVTPGADAYELRMVNGAPVVFSAGTGGYAAHTICLTH